MRTRAAIYARISDARGDDTAGVDRQQEDCLALCAERGWEVVGVYVDNSKSAYSGKRRPAYEQMLAEIRAGNVDVLVAYSSDRIYRRLGDLERLVDELGSTQVATVKSGRVDLTTADGRMTARILGSVGQHESEKRGERVKRAYEQRRAQGKNVGGYRRFGYTKDASALVEDEAAALRLGYEMVMRGASLGEVARTFFEQGFRSRSKDKTAIPPATIREQLLRPINAGLVEVNGEMVAGVSQAPALIDVETWEVVRAILTDPARKKNTQGRPSINLASGIAVCGVCGGKMLASARGGKGDGNSRKNYRCRSSQRIQGPSCVTRSRDLVDGFITNVILGYLELHRHEIASALGRLKAGAPVDNSADIAEAERIRRELASLAELLASGTLGAADFAAATSKLRARLDVVEESIAPSATTSSATAELLDRGADIKASWEALDVYGKRRIITELVDRIVIDRCENHTEAERSRTLSVRWRLAPADLRAA